MEERTENAMAVWSVPECPFRIEYSRSVLDDIRLAVVDAFFSLPRGGAEIGGILIGKYENRRLSIVDHAPLDCEHAVGPSFTLSPRDHSKLLALVASARRDPHGRRLVGWYHSHTRSEISLSEADLDIHKRYFGEIWQVALVLKPHTFNPTRAGFFFRGPDGTIDGTASHGEFELEPLPVMPAPSGPEPLDTSSLPAAKRNGRTPVPAALPDPEPEPAQAEEPEPPPIALPSFARVESKPALPRRWIWAVAAIAAVAAIGAGGFATRQLWWPGLMSLWPRLMSLSVPASAPPSLGLNCFDTDGQLQIRWDRNSPAVRAGVAARLEITDGGPLASVVPLDQPHLQTGVFTYGRQNDRVDVKLIVDQPRGQPVREVAGFLGRPLVPNPSPEDLAIRRDRDDLLEAMAKLKLDLKTQTDRARQLEKLLAAARADLREEQLRRRLANQSR